MTWFGEYYVNCGSVRPGECLCFGRCPAGKNYEPDQ